MVGDGLKWFQMGTKDTKATKERSWFKIPNIDIVIQILEPHISYLRPLLVERFGCYAGGCSLCRVLVHPSGKTI